MEAIRFVDTAAGVDELRDHLLTVEASDRQGVVGLDTEWKPVAELTKTSPASILQVSYFVAPETSFIPHSRRSPFW